MKPAQARGGRDAARRRQAAAVGLGVLLVAGPLTGCGVAKLPPDSTVTSATPPPAVPPNAQSTPSGTSATRLPPGTDVTIGRVVKVTDGDTIHVAVAGGPSNEDVRIIGVDTPEVVDPRKPVQCFGPQASARAHTLLDGARVTLSTDPTQATVDVHGRALRMVTLADGSNYAETTVAAGYGRAYKVRGPAPSNWATLTNDQTAARSAHRGLWAPRPAGCAGGT